MVSVRQVEHRMEGLTEAPADVVFEYPDWNGKVWVQIVGVGCLDLCLNCATQAERTGQLPHASEIVWCRNKGKLALTLCFLF